MRRPSRRTTWLILGLVVLLGAPAAWVGQSWSRFEYRAHLGDGQAMTIPGALPAATTGAPTAPTVAMSAPYVAGISANGRYFVDQHGDPFLVRGDSPWSLLADLTPAQIDAYWADRASHGVDAAIVSLLGAGANGGTDDGAMIDGVLPFEGGRLPWDTGSVTRPNPAYLARAHQAVASAASAGITVFMYPLDGWTVGHVFRPTSIDQCVAWGRTVATTFADLPNLVWVLGGDFYSHHPVRDSDRCFDAVRTGLRAAGDTRPISIQFTSPLTWSTQDAYWRTRVDWNFLYSYAPTYEGSRAAWAETPARPVVLGESNYEGMNLEPGTPDTTNESLRRQVAWALTSGAAGDFYGSADWEFLPGWQGRLDRPGLDQVAALRAVFAGLPWWKLEPADDGVLLTATGHPAGTDPRVDVLDDDHPTAAVTSDGSTAVVYLPVAMTVTLSSTVTALAGHARWVDPSTGASHDADPSWRTTGTVTTPGANADGGHDWLLILDRST